MLKKVNCIFFDLSNSLHHPSRTLTHSIFFTSVVGDGVKVTSYLIDPLSYRSMRAESTPARTWRCSSATTWWMDLTDSKRKDWLRLLYF